MQWLHLERDLGIHSHNVGLDFETPGAPVEPHFVPEQRALDTFEHIVAASPMSIFDFQNISHYKDILFSTSEG